MTKRSDVLTDLPSVSELVETFDAMPIAEARADLSRTVERVAISGRPVIVTRHDRPRVAIVPVDMLARDRARFLAGAARASAEPPGRPQADDVSFEAVEGLSAGTLREKRRETEADAAAEDAASTGPAAATGWAVEQLFDSPVFERAVARAVGQMMLQLGR